jgi:hypothetical protein
MDYTALAAAFSEGLINPVRRKIIERRYKGRMMTMVDTNYDKVHGRFEGYGDFGYKLKLKSGERVELNPRNVVKVIVGR